MAIPRFQKSDPAADVAAAVLEHGVAIVESLYPAELTEGVLKEGSPHLANAEVGNGAFFGNSSKNVPGVIRWSPSYRKMLMDPLFLEIGDRTLGPNSVDGKWTFSAAILFSVASSASIPDGTHLQPLHTDDTNYPQNVKKPGDAPIVMSAGFGLTDYSAETGATRFIVDGHRRDNDRPLTEREAETESAEMPAGSVLFYLGSIPHGFGINRTSEPRCGISLINCVGWLRQEENLYISVPAEDAVHYPETLIQKLGYATQGLALGMVMGRRSDNLFMEANDDDLQAELDEAVKAGRPLG